MVTDTLHPELDPRGKPTRLDRLVDLLAGLGVTPNRLSWFGFGCALAAAYCLLRGASHGLPLESGFTTGPTSWWPAGAAAFIVLSSAGDILDGRLARRHGLSTPYGALLDSVLDRFADMALFGACAVHFASIGNLTYVVLACVGLAAAVQTSYVKARGENLTKGLDAGFWQRGERIACLLAGSLSGHVATSLWILATFPYLTVVRRMREARRRLEGYAGDVHEPGEWRPWRMPRRTWSYRLFAGAITLFIFASTALHPAFRGLGDPLGRWFVGP